jgi:benzoyl-CoA reductase/2-hydroxyglutaryl-CoA dehydratase subunit BcrC/BadD/HgdB
MWADLNLDLEAHDTLLDVLGSLYKDTFLAQENRPKGMSYLDFVISEVHGLRIKELQDAREKGLKVIGTFCVFVPDELIIAADAVSVGLCAGAEFGFDKAEQLLPRNTCSLIKSFFGFKTSRVCPYVEAADMVVGETTCDGKKKAYEIFKELQPNLYVMELPQMKAAQDRELLKSEYIRFKSTLEELTGVTIDAERLKRGNQVAFYDDPPRFTDSINKVCDELEVRVKEGAGVAPGGTPRILIAGCPMAVPNWKLPAIIETTGGVIVGEDSCVGERGARNLVDESGSDVESLLDAIVDRYFQIDCAVFTPNPERLEHIESMVQGYRADGVILYSLQFCTPYMIEAFALERVLGEKAIPCMRIETDYSQEDIGPLKTRVEAFLEQLRG